MTWFRWNRGHPDKATAAEMKVMDMEGVPLKYENTPVGPSAPEYIHSISNERGDPSTDKRTTVVIMPGYGAGSGFYFKNIRYLSSFFKFEMVDWLGTGLSGRPRFDCKTTEEAEDFFIESLATWMRKKGYDKEKVVLVGHSLGGYLSATYAARYPEHIKHLVMVGPAGIPKMPSGDKWLPDRFKNPLSAAGAAFRVFKGLWLTGVTPGSVIRGLGPMGERLAQRYAGARFRSAGLSEEETKNFSDYMYQILTQRGSGEFALNLLLHPFAYAKKCWAERLETIRVPTTFVYGEHDWMKPKDGFEASDRVLSILGGKRRSDTDLRVFVLPNSGHFVFLDQPALFDSTMHEVLKEYIPADVASPGAHPAWAAAAEWKPTTRFTRKGDVWVVVEPTAKAEDQPQGYREEKADVEPLG